MQCRLQVAVSCLVASTNFTTPPDLPFVAAPHVPTDKAEKSLWLYLSKLHLNCTPASQLGKWLRTAISASYRGYPPVSCGFQPATQSTHGSLCQEGAWPQASSCWTPVFTWQPRNWATKQRAPAWAWKNILPTPGRPSDRKPHKLANIWIWGESNGFL